MSWTKSNRVSFLAGMKKRFCVNRMGRKRGTKTTGRSRWGGGRIVKRVGDSPSLYYFFFTSGKPCPNDNRVTGRTGENPIVLRASSTLDGRGWRNCGQSMTWMNPIKLVSHPDITYITRINGSLLCTCEYKFSIIWRQLMPFLCSY